MSVIVSSRNGENRRENEEQRTAYHLLPRAVRPLQPARWVAVPIWDIRPILPHALPTVVFHRLRARIALAAVSADEAEGVPGTGQGFLARGHLLLVWALAPRTPWRHWCWC